MKTTRYDMYGSVFFSFDIVVLQSLEEKTLYGILQDAPNPAIGMVPLPGMELAYYSGGRNYYLDNERIGIGPYGDIEAIIVGNDTLTYAMELTVTLTSTMKIDNNLEPYYRVYISKATITTSVQESSLSEIQIYPNPTKGFIEIFTEQQINSVYVYDYTGHVLFNKTCNSRQSLLDLQDYNGLVIIQIVFENGLIVNRKVVVR